MNLRKFSGKCTACGKEVLASEDATILEAIFYNESNLVFASKPKHICCSPSRAQYIVHPDFAPVQDNRPEYDKRLQNQVSVSSYEKIWTDAWVELQRMCNEQARDSS